jgi:hypothetical protein
MKKLKRMRSILALLMVLCVIAVAPASAWTKQTEIEKLKSCAELEAAGYGYGDCDGTKIDINGVSPNVPYTFDLLDSNLVKVGEVTLVFSGTVDDPKQYVAWTSTIPICAVVVADGEPAGAYLYEYDPAAYSDSGLTTPINPESGNYPDISYVLFCYKPYIPTPEFPTLAVPVGLLIGVVYAVGTVRARRVE